MTAVHAHPFIYSADPPGRHLPSRRLRPDADEPGRADGNRSDHGFAQGGEVGGDGRGSIRDHRTGDSPFRGDQPARGPARGAGRAGGARRRQQVGDHRPRLQRPLRQQAAGADRRPFGVHAAVRRGVLGAPGPDAGGHRAHRGDPRSGRHAVGGQRGQRGDQHHHPGGRPDPGGAGEWSAGQPGARSRGPALGGAG